MRECEKRLQFYLISDFNPRSLHHYRRYEPFPVESSLGGALPDHFNAEVVAGTITSKQVRLLLAISS